MLTVYPVLSIAGSDSSGGAGIQADVKTIESTGCYAMTAVTAVTAQNTMGVGSVSEIAPALVAEQIDMTVTDIMPLAVKTGMLCSAATVEAVASAIERHGLRNVVVDPVILSTSGRRLLDEEGVEALKTRLLPLADIITPNVDEAAALTGAGDTAGQIAALRRMGARGILIKGGDDTGRPDLSIDTFAPADGSEPIELRADRVRSVNTHGTGCTLSSAAAAFLALGFPPVDAVKAAKSYVTRALIASSRLAVGSGHGPMMHNFAPRKFKTRHIH